jgi:hypothetical protein
VQQAWSSQKMVGRPISPRFAGVSSLFGNRITTAPGCWGWVLGPGLSGGRLPTDQAGANKNDGRGEGRVPRGFSGKAGKRWRYLLLISPCLAATDPCEIIGQLDYFCLKLVMETSGPGKYLRELLLWQPHPRIDDIIARLSLEKNFYPKFLA